MKQPIPVRLKSFLVCASLATSLAACATPAAAPAAKPAAAPTLPAASPNVAQVSIIAKDFAFDLPDEISSGWTSLTLTNEGKSDHHAIVSRLKEGVTLDQVKAELIKPDGDQSKVSDLGFFMPDTNPGSSNQATVNLMPGTWLIFSVSRSDFKDPTPDWARGSIKQFKVVGNPTTASPALQPDVTVTIGKDNFDMPSELEAGKHVIEVVNNSGAPNGYAFFIKLEGDGTMKDVMASFDAMFAGKQPEKMVEMKAVGGLMANNLGQTFYTGVDLQPGNYAIITNINATGFPYSGLSKSFTVK